MGWDEGAFEMFIGISSRVKRYRHLYPPELLPSGAPSLAETVWSGSSENGETSSSSGAPEASLPQVTAALPTADVEKVPAATGDLSTMDVDATEAPGAIPSFQTTGSTTSAMAPASTSSNVASTGLPATSASTDTPAATPLPVALATLAQTDLETLDAASLAARLDGIVGELAELTGAAFMAEAYLHHVVTARDDATRKAAHEGVRRMVQAMQRLLGPELPIPGINGLAPAVAGDLNPATTAATSTEGQTAHEFIPITTSNANVGPT